MVVNNSSSQRAKRTFLEVVKEVYSTMKNSNQQVEKSPTQTEQEADSTKQLMSEEQLLREVCELRTVEEKLVHACKQGEDQVSLSVMKQLLENSALGDIVKNACDKSSNNCSLLHLCAARNKIRCMEFLLQEMNVPVDSLDSISATPLLYAVAAKKEDAASLLLSCGANVNHKDIYNRYPFLVAVKNKYFRLADILRSVPQCDIHLRGSKGNTVLHVACEDGDLQSVKYLIEQCQASPMRRNNEEQNPLYLGFKYPSIASYLGSQYSSRGLGKLVVNVDCFGRSILHEACNDNNTFALLSVLTHLDANGVTSEQIRAFINQPDRTGNTPLIMAVKSSQIDMINILCSSIELDINTSDRVGNTALYHAINRKERKAIDIISAAGGSLKADDKEGDFAEHKENLILNKVKSLNALLIIVLCLLVVMSITVIAAITFSFFGANNTENGERLRRMRFSQVTDFLEHNVKQVTQVGITAAAAFQGKYNVSNADEVLEYAWRTLPPNFGVVPLMSSSYCGLPTGEIAGLIRRSQNKSEMEYFGSYDNIYNISFVRVSDIATRTLDYSSATFSQLTSDADWNGTWVQSARENEGSKWTLSFVSAAYPGFLWISFVTSFRDQFGKFVGYCGLDAATEVIRDFIQTSPETRDSTIAIIERQTGYLITTSDANVLLFSTAEDGSFVRYTGKDSGNKLIEVMTQRNPVFGNNFQSFTSKEFIFSKVYVDGKRFGIQMANLNDGRGIDWIVVHALPMSTFYRNFYISFIIMACCTLVLLIIGVIASIVVARIVMNPIELIIKQADDIKMLQLEKVEQSLSDNLSYFSEIRTLQYSFRSMAGRIKQFRSFIPDHILSVIEAEANRGSENNISFGTVDESSVDTESDSRGMSITEGHLNARGLISNALQTSLTSANISVMLIQFSDLNEILEYHTASDIAETTRELLSSLKRAIGATNGQFVFVTAKQAMIAWNTLINQNDHAAKACKTARLCMQQLNTLQAQWRSRDLPALDISIGVSSGTAYFGNVGTERNKFFTVIGSTVTRAERLCQLNEKWKTHILCSEQTVDSVKHEYSCRQLCSKSGKVFELGWDEMEHWKDFSQAYQFFEQNKYADAANLLANYLSVHSDDSAAQKLLDKCDSYLHNSDR